MDCLSGKKSRRDVAALMRRCKTVDAVVAEMQDELKSRKLNLKPMWYSYKEDASSRKVRCIGIQDIKQQLYDYVAVYGLHPVFARIGGVPVRSYPWQGPGLRAEGHPEVDERPERKVRL